VALRIDDHTIYPEYRFELLDAAGALLWAGRRPPVALLGDAGTTVALVGVAPGRYRLRIEGLRAGGADLLGDYLLAVEPNDVR
jgi:hypothetical protein